MSGQSRITLMERLWKAVMFVATRRCAFTAHDLAEELEVTSRSGWRYVKLLEGFGLVERIDWPILVEEPARQHFAPTLDKLRAALR